MAIQSNFPSLKPTLLLDFANTKQLDPRITFTRASTATYYDGKTVAMAEQNLLTYSGAQSNAAWVASSITVGTATTGPDGTSSAYPLTATAANGTLLQTFTATATAYTFSIYIQRVTGTGNIDITVDGTTYATQTTTGTWTRFTITTTPAAGSKTAGIRIATSGDVVNVAFAQLENRSSVTAYTATTTAPITNYIPVLQTAASGVARFEHNPVTGESLGLEIEEQRTNLLTYSEQFDDASWTKSNTSIIANIAVAPDGTVTADSSVANTTAAEHTVGKNASLTSGTTYTMTFYVKAAGYSVFRIRFSSSAFGTAQTVEFNLSSVSATTVNGTPVGSITSVGNGWYRITSTATATVTASSFISAYPVIGGSSTGAGDGYSGIYIWGAQLEAGAFATSYIPTVASQVTRSADSASMTGTNFSSWYRADEGTFYAEFAPSSSNFGANRNIFLASDGTSNNFNGLRYGSTGSQPAAAVTVAGVIQSNITSGTMVAGTSYKMVGAYKVNDFAMIRDAGTVGTDTSGTLPVVTQAEIGALSGTSISSQMIKKLAYYPLRVTNAQLQAMTTV